MEKRTAKTRANGICIVVIRDEKKVNEVEVAKKKVRGNEVQKKNGERKKKWGPAR